MNSQTVNAWITSVADTIYKQARGYAAYGPDDCNPMEEAIKAVKQINNNGVGFTIRWTVSENEQRESQNVSLNDREWAQAVDTATDLYNTFILQEIKPVVREGSIYNNYTEDEEQGERV